MTNRTRLATRSLGALRMNDQLEITTHRQPDLPPRNDPCEVDLPIDERETEVEF